MKNKFLIIFLVLCLLFSATACSKKVDEPDASPGVLVPDAKENIESPLPDSGVNQPSNSGNADKAGENAEHGITENEQGAIISTGGSLNGATADSSGFIQGGYNYSGENYGERVENKFISTKENNLSTFAADVDTASYTRLRRYIAEDYTQLPTDAVRVEEMINYFSYDYKEPQEGEPFSVETEIFDCFWNSESKLLKIGVATKEPDYSAMPKSNLVFLIDVSGSMASADKLPLVQQAFSMLSENLKKEDKISIVTYAASDSVVLDGVSGSDQYAIQTAIENLTAGGGTYGSKGIITAYELASKHFIKGGNNRVILATDGDLNIGITDTEELKNLIIEKKNSGVFLSVMGFGTGNLQDDKLEALADNGNGNYSYIDSKTEARRVLTEEMGGTLFTVAKDVKFQLEFNADAVAEYRLIGYENRIMASEDFEDDSKDGGEIGAGHKVTILYELKMKDEGADKWAVLNVRYKEPEGDKSALKVFDIKKEQYTKDPSENSIFAASVAQFGMLLSKSEYVSGNYADIYSRLAKLQCVKEDVYKKELSELVKKIIE
ncbi:MAG: VWA domain-containing protein [Clostridia bacterium]|nr:VWA domain-containing protein [Clostridia bacterium]